MLIELNRIVSKKKKDDQGNLIKDPVDKSKHQYYNITSVESFESEDIKRMRPWNRRKGSSEYLEIEGDITVLQVMTMGKNKEGEWEKKMEEIRVNESYPKLLDRLNGIKLEDNSTAGGNE